jgi:glycine/D-amino acid oxidase-like deaminating enzyme
MPSIRSRHQASCPAPVEIVLVGGSIAGVSTALFLTRQGMPVLLCEKGILGGEQSSRNSRWIGKQKRDPREMALCFDSLQVWSSFARSPAPASADRHDSPLREQG